jgi:hypothetical protein
VHYAITKMMSKEREFRYRDCGEVVRDLTRFLPAAGVPPIVLPVARDPQPGPSVPKSPVVKPVSKARIRSSGEIRRSSGEIRRRPHRW